MTDRPFRFGAVATSTASGDDWKRLSRRVQRSGFSTLQLADHFTDQFAPMPALAATAAVTTTLRVGSLVFCNDFRRPVSLAKELATLDVLSDGRVEWGMGAGWLGAEHASAGIPFDRHAERVDRLAEAVTIMRELLAGGTSSHEGRHYRTDGVTGHPPAVQRPHPPLLIGASGQRLLRYAANEADIVGIGPSLSTSPAFGSGRVPYDEATARQIAWIEDASAGRREPPERHMVAFPVIVTADAAETAAVRARVADSRGLPVEEVAASPHALIGTVDEIVEVLQERRERWGVSYWSLPVQLLDAVAPIVERAAGR